MTPNTTYQLAESGGDPRYVQDDNRTNLQTNPLSTGSMTCVQIDALGNVIPGYSDGINGGVSVPLGYSVRCTAINRTAPLILIKHVINDNGGTAVAANWNLTATPTTPPAVPAGLVAQTVPGSEIANPANIIYVRPGQPYILTESALAGYTLTGISCVTSVNANPRALTNITLAANESGVCTYTNDDNPRLTLVKKVVNHAGTDITTAALAQQWTLTATGTGGFSGAGNTAAVTNQTVNPAQPYALSETTVPGYTNGTAWSCTGGGAFTAPNQIVLGNSTNATCTITNTEIQPTLILKKQVTGPRREPDLLRRLDADRDRFGLHHPDQRQAGGRGQRHQRAGELRNDLHLERIGRPGGLHERDAPGRAPAVAPSSARTRSLLGAGAIVTCTIINSLDFKPLTVDKTVTATYDRTYLWSIAKDVGQTSVTTTPGGNAIFHYTVTATPGTFQDSNWAMSGTITVTNANPVAVPATVTDVPTGVGGGVSCTVTGGAGATIPANSSTHVQLRLHVHQPAELHRRHQHRDRDLDPQRRRNGQQHRQAGDLRAGDRDEQDDPRPGQQDHRHLRRPGHRDLERRRHPDHLPLRPDPGRRRRRRVQRRTPTPRGSRRPTSRPSRRSTCASPT